MLFPGCGELNYPRETGNVSLEATVSLFRFEILLALMESNGDGMMLYS